MRGRPRCWKGWPAACGAIALFGLLAACGDTVPDADVLCFVEDNPEDGTQLVTCNNGEDFVIADGRVGAAGTGCRTQDNSEDGTVDMVCDNGLRFTVFDGRDGSSCRIDPDENVRDAIIIICDDGSTGTIDDGISCTTTADAEAGSVTISCEDGTTATVFNGDEGEACSVVRDEETQRVTVLCGGDEGAVVDGEDGDTCRVVEDAETLDVSIICGEGDDASEEVVIPGSTRIATVIGVATLLGETDHSGIAVEVVGLEDLVTTTNADGSYSLARLPIGVRAFQLSAPGYSSVVVDNVPVLPGEVVLDPVELRTTELVAAGTRNVVLDVCGDGSMVVFLMNARPFVFPFAQEDVWIGRLAVWESGDLAPTVIAENAVSVDIAGDGACPGGESVVYRHDVDIANETTSLSIWSKARGTSRDFTLDLPSVVESAAEADRYLLISFDPEAEETVAEAYDVATDVLDAIDANDIEDWRIAADGSYVLLTDLDGLKLYRFSDGTEFLLSDNTDSFFDIVESEDHRLLAYVDDDHETASLNVFDVARGTVANVASGPSGDFSAVFVFSPDGHWLAYAYDYDSESLNEAYQMAYYDVLGDESFDLATIGLGRSTYVELLFDPSSNLLAFYNLAASPDSIGTIDVWDLAEDAETNAFGQMRANFGPFSPDGAWIVATDSSGDSLILDAEDFGTGPSVGSFVAWSPDSRGFVADDEFNYLADWPILDDPIDLDPNGVGSFEVEFSEDGSRLGVNLGSGVAIYNLGSRELLLETDDDSDYFQVLGNTFLIFSYYTPSGTNTEVADLYGVFPRDDELLLLDTSLLSIDKGDFVMTDGPSAVWQTAHTTAPDYFFDALRFMRTP